MQTDKAKNITYFKEMNLIHEPVARVGQEVTFLHDGFHCPHRPLHK